MPSREFSLFTRLIARWRVFTLHTQYQLLTEIKCFQCTAADDEAIHSSLTNNVRILYDKFFKPPSPIIDHLTLCVSQLMVIRALPFFVL